MTQADTSDKLSRVLRSINLLFVNSSCDSDSCNSCAEKEKKKEKNKNNNST